MKRPGCITRQATLSDGAAFSIHLIGRCSAVCQEAHYLWGRQIKATCIRSSVNEFVIADRG
jgi:hypothetical protein